MCDTDGSGFDFLEYVMDILFLLFDLLKDVSGLIPLFVGAVISQ